MSDTSLLPSSASPFEREMAAATAALDTVDPAAIETLWDPWACPRQLLPWLASALSVDLWDDGWNEVRRRQAIADSPNWHRIKGTVAAVRAAVGLVARRALVLEWFQMVPQPGRRGTAVVVAEAEPGADLVRTAADVRRMVDLSKPKSRAVPVRLGLIMDAPAPVACAIGVLARITLEPFPRSIPAAETPLIVQIAHWTAARIRLEPRTA